MLNKSSLTQTYLGKKFLTEQMPILAKEFSLGNIHLMPKIQKIVVSMRLGKDNADKKAIEAAMQELSLITGQRPAYAKAKKSISGFKLRENQIVGIYVTLRKKMMFEFLERLVYIALPRIRDFKGYKAKSFDANYNFTFGIKEHLVFNELTYDKIFKTRGMDISLHLKNITSKEMGVYFLKMFNFPIKL